MKRYIFWLIIFAALEISLALYLTYWRESFWQSVSEKQFSGFMTQLYIFTFAALAICFVSGFSGYLVSLTGIEWRKRLNSRAFKLHEHNVKMNKDIENLNQRIQEDCMSYPDLFLQLLFGFIKSIFYILVFSISMLLSFSWVYLGILFAYSFIGTLVTHYIAKPLIRLNYENQRAEATYRNDLTVTNFKDCIYLMLGLARKQKNLTYWQQFYGQVGVVVPLVIIAPVYFSTGMTLGNLMRFNSLSSTILDSLSYGVTSFGTINKLLSCKKRLREAGIL